MNFSIIVLGHFSDLSFYVELWLKLPLVGTKTRQKLRCLYVRMQTPVKLGDTHYSPMAPIHG